MRNGDVEETGLAAGVLNNPPAGVFWLANKLAQHGTVLKAGEIILAGSFTKPMWVHKGDEIVADFGPLGVIECRFI
jgi:2-oxo-hept-3-ene-1,7-dioate hydratase